MAQLGFFFRKGSSSSEESAAVVRPARPRREPTPLPSGELFPEGPQSVVIRAAADVLPDAQAAAARLTDRLARGMGEPVRLVVTDNRRTMVSARRRPEALGQRLEVRAHHMFLSAPEEVWDHLVRYLKHRDKRSGHLIDAFIQERRQQIRGKRATRQPSAPRTAGAHHDLRLLFDRLEATCFPGALEGVRITWGRRTKRRRGQRSLQLGTYTPSEMLIRIHPVLDQEWVPQFYVAAVIHHEMLHHILPPVREGNRMRYHTPEFRRRERAFVYAAESAAWETANLNRLLRSME